jgi:hypothetical protein
MEVLLEMEPQGSYKIVVPEILPENEAARPNYKLPLTGSTRWFMAKESDRCPQRQ